MNCSLKLQDCFSFISAERSQQQSGKGNKTPINNDHPDNKKPTWISDIFQGIFTSETRCLNCETVTSKDEDFFDLSIDVEQNTSITSCLKNFSNTETLCSDNKFQCDSCCTLQEAHVSLIFFAIFPGILTNSGIFDFFGHFGHFLVTSITSYLKNFSNTETLFSDNKFQCDSNCILQKAHVSVFMHYFWPVLAFFNDFQPSLHILWQILVCFLAFFNHFGHFWKFLAFW